MNFEYQPGKLVGYLIESNHEEYSYSLKIKLIISGETIQCHKVK